jgi:hypothetical protein
MVGLKKQWPAGALIENGTTAAQGTSGREKLKFGWLEATRWLWWARGAQGREREPAW